MARCKVGLICLLYVLCSMTAFSVQLRTSHVELWAVEFNPVVLTCLMDSVITKNPRVEWKKVQNGIQTYVYTNNEATGDLKDRARLLFQASLMITRTYRSDTAVYRCAVAAMQDERQWDQIEIKLNVMVKPEVPKCTVPKVAAAGASVELSCTEPQGIPSPFYQWFHNETKLAVDPAFDSHRPKPYTMNMKTGVLTIHNVTMENAGDYYCEARNEIGFSQCPPQHMYMQTFNVVLYGLQVCAMVVAATAILVCLCYIRKIPFRKISCHKKTEETIQQNKGKCEVQQNDDVSETEGNFHHIPSCVV